MLKKLPSRNRKKMTDNKINEEQSFIQHLEALRRMLIKSIFAVVFLSPIGFYAAPRCIDFLIKHSLPEQIGKLHYFSPMEVFIIQLKTGLIIAFILAFPFIVFQVKKFVVPALYENERKFLGCLVVLSTLLFILGSVFCIFFILPLIMNFSAGFSNSHLEATLGLGNFINLAAGLILAFGLMFQFPLLVLSGVKFGLVEVETLKNARPYIIIGILVISALLTPPDIISQIMLGVPTWLLFEAGLLAAVFLDKKSKDF